MAKGSSDVILRDRMQFTLDATGDRTTVYGRIDLSDYVNAVEKKGLNVKEILFQPRDPNASGLPNTGVFNYLANLTNASGSAASIAAMKIYATTRAYENASDVGIASPDVCAVEEWGQTIGPVQAGQNPIYSFFHSRYGPTDLHPAGFTLVSDLLVGVAFDNYDVQDDDTLEVDVMIIAEPVTVTSKQITNMLTQAQDL
tara:strand:+ start:1225 stop:1821 length:597 start_codon:yes stop_codon:yes gene_type:complete